MRYSFFDINDFPMVKSVFHEYRYLEGGGEEKAIRRLMSRLPVRVVDPAVWKLSGRVTPALTSQVDVVVGDYPDGKVT